MYICFDQIQSPFFPFQLLSHLPSNFLLFFLIFEILMKVKLHYFPFPPSNPSGVPTSWLLLIFMSPFSLIIIVFHMPLAELVLVLLMCM